MREGEGEDSGLGPGQGFDITSFACVGLRWAGQVAPRRLGRPGSRTPQHSPKSLEAAGRFREPPGPAKL